MTENAPSRPAGSSREGGGLLTTIGESALGAMQLFRGLFATWTSAFRSAQAEGIGAAEVCRGIALRQVFYTGFQALSLVSVVALFMGATLVIQTELLGAALHRDTAGRVLVAVILRELAPLLTAIIVCGRSGTAIATELGIMRVNSEVLALASLGVDPPRFLVWPRIVATLIAVPVLTVYFSGMTLFGGLVAAFLMDPYSVGDWRSGIALGLTPMDLPLFLVKSVGLGGLVGWICCYFGLTVGTSPTEVPQKASRAVVASLLSIIVFDTLVTVAFYSVFGARLA